MRGFWFLIVYLFCLNAYAGNYSVNIYSQKNVTAGITPTILIQANQVRQYLLIQSNGSANVSVSFANCSNPGILIPPGGNYEPIKAEMDSICMSSVSAGQTVLVVEGQ
jgi:hypothetical protein